ncbi:MAG: glycosyltransferase family 39 protein, partial [Anaerolineales bacterium]|nr:glycosyltransferase family 39 protein [Anaerolineales bacterium]
MDEPSILDYLKAKLTPWRGPAPEIPVLEPDEQAEDREGFESGHQPEAVPREFTEPSTQSTPQPSRQSAPWPWQALLALCLALIAQLTLEPGPDRTWKIGFFLYLISFAFLIWAFWRSEWMKPSPRQGEAQSTEINTKPFVTRPVYFLLALPVTLIAFLTFGGNLFTTLNVFLWLLAIFLVMRAFWVPSSAGRSWWGRVRDFIDHPQWKLNISRWTLIVLAGLAVVVFFRAYRIDQVPPEMVSDHAEKLLDVWDVLQGQTRIFFPRNTGREAMQMYLTATIIRVFGTDYSFTSLKLGTVLAGLLTLPFIYLLGVELGNRRAGFLAMIFAGIAYWPNVISRVGLRFPLYPLFVAPALYFLVRGLRRGKVNDFILSGLALGIGLHGYTPIRVLPIVIVIAVGLYLLHRESVGNRRQVVKGLIVLTLVAMVLFLPLLRYSLEDPEMFAFRSFSRLGSLERPLPGPAWQIFFGNLWKAMIMFTWDNGEIWVHSVTHRPALDVVSAALFSLGIVLLLMRYLRKRQWFDLFLLLSVPLLMLPSVLSLAFPAENPSLNRAAGAIVPVFLILGIALDALLDVFEKKLE